MFSQIYIFSGSPAIFLKFIKIMCLDALKNVQLMALTFKLITLSFKNTLISRNRIEFKFYLFTLLVALETAFQDLTFVFICPSLNSKQRLICYEIFIIYFYLITMLIRRVIIHHDRWLSNNK